jgi:predicted acyl esterase
MFLLVAGQPFAQLSASTSGSDSDWVVKIIDVWPAEVPDHPQLGGYQQMLSADILRGRYREDPANPRALQAGAVLTYTVRLPNVSHTFLPGHRIMVQIQSTWFPLYDRNPRKVHTQHHAREAVKTLRRRRSGSGTCPAAPARSPFLW